jgi:hypothetical protein
MHVSAESMNTGKITTAEDVYKFAETLESISQQSGAIQLTLQLDNAMRLGSSGLEILGAIRQIVIENRTDVERLLGPEGTSRIDQVVAFVDEAFGRKAV